MRAVCSVAAFKKIRARTEASVLHGLRDVEYGETFRNDDGMNVVSPRARRS